MEPIVFFSRSKPQGADIIDLSIKLRKVFIGYPPFKKDAEFNPDNIKECMLDISEGVDKDLLEMSGSYAVCISTNVNLVKDIGRESYVIIPRPERGIYYVAMVENFEVADNPTWWDDYKEIRLKQGLDWDNPKSHIGDVVQFWNVGEFHEITPYNVPGWIRHSLFGRSTTGRIYDYDKDNVAYDVMDRLFNNKPIELKSTRDKLLHYLTPGMFEHFMANLFLLDKDERWIQIGGSGDGGIDCIGYDADGNTAGVAQCKLKKQSLGKLEQLLDSMMFKGEKYVANFYCQDKIPDGEKPGIYNQDRIIALFEKHPESNYWKMIQA